MRFWLIKYYDKVVGKASSKAQADNLMMHIRAQFVNCNMSREGWSVILAEEGVDYVVESAYDCSSCG